MTAALLHALAAADADSRAHRRACPAMPLTMEYRMKPDAVPARYAGPMIALHWLMLLLLAGVYACIELTGEFPKGDPMRDALRHWHFMLGLSVLALVLLRLALRLATRVPPVTPGPAPWGQRLAELLHLALYALMIGMPVAGWLILSAAGKPIPFFGLELPPLVAPDKELAHQVRQIHGTVGNIGYFLVGLHATAALFHHYIARDDTLLRMLPPR